MDLNSEDYKYLKHRIVTRQWGVECAFVVDHLGKTISDVISIDDPKIDEKDLAKAILTRLLKLAELEAAQEAAIKIFTEVEVISLLVEKGYLSKEQTLGDLMTKDELLLAAGK